MGQSNLYCLILILTLCGCSSKPHSYEKSNFYLYIIGFIDDSIYVTYNNLSIDTVCINPYFESNKPVKINLYPMNVINDISFINLELINLDTNVSLELKLDSSYMFINLLTPPIISNVLENHKNIVTFNGINKDNLPIPNSGDEIILENELFGHEVLYYKKPLTFKYLKLLENGRHYKSGFRIKVNGNTLDVLE